MAKNEKDNMMNKIVSLCKRRGYIFQSSEIYGGLDSCYDYGPLGTELKKNIKNFWMKSMVQLRDDIVGLDSSILMHPKIWQASGHVDGFVDPMVDCKTCKGRFRADQLETTPCLNKPSKMVTECGGELTDVRQFNLMFKTHMGPLEENAAVVYLRPETAQGIYVNYTNVLQSTRQKVPFGIAQIGKAFRNEITPRNFIFRTREFEQMEMQFFVKPGTDDEWFEYWKEQRIQWYDGLGIKKDNLRFHQHGEKELAHYASAAFDIEFKFPFGWQELEGVHNRTDFDLKRHQESSGKNFEYFDDLTREKFVPYIIETSAGCDRALLTCLVDAYEEEELEKDTRTVLRLDPKIAPLKAGIFPLVKKDGMPEMARKIKADLENHMMVFYDEGGAVGRRYRRQDEAGTPFCITVDSESLENNTVTIRERDAMTQERISTDKLLGYLMERIV